jgi:hypothetical protein
VIQEIILAQDVQFVLADEIIPLDIFETVVNIFRDVNEFLDVSRYQSRSDFQDMILRAIQLSQIFSYRNTRLSGGDKAISPQHGEPQLSLASCVLNLSSGRECTDPRDRIYALLGIAAADLDIEPDYTLAVSCVFNNFAIRSLLAGSLSVLHASGIYPGHDPNLPSFEPNIGGSLGITSRLDSSELRFSAAKSLPLVVCSSSTSTVSVRGVCVDTVSRSTNFSPYAPEVPTGRLTFTIPVSFVNWFAHQQGLVKARDAIRGIKELQALGSYLLYRDTSLAELLVRTISLDTLSVPKSVKLGFHEPKSDIANESRITFFITNSVSMNLPAPFTKSYRENRHWFQTKQGYFGLGPSWMKPDDLVVIFDGGKTPFVLRNVVSKKRKRGDTWQLVGECFLLGWMHGDYFGHTVVDEMPPKTEDDSDDKKYLVREMFTLV